MMDRVEITKSTVGIFGMQVCVEKGVTDEEILSLCNKDNPSGTSAGWSTVVRNTNQSYFLGPCGKPNDLPIGCMKHKGRQHLIVLC